MDDGDLGENIAEHTEVIDDAHHDGDGEGYGDGADDVHTDPARWWFASAAFPMVAGTLGPVASAFSICALVNNWRQYIPPGSNITIAEFVPDPDWLYVVNAIQLAIAVIANIFLLLNMTKRVRFSVAQPITIVGWYLSSILLISLSATAGGPLPLLEPKEEYVWAQAFYYGIFAAILYFVVASLMAVTFWGARAGHYPPQFELTLSQRTLMLQTILFLAYLLLGALIFSHIEGWFYLDTVYWANVTLFTVGFGDFFPETNLGRGLLIPYALIGIICLGLVIGSIRSLMLDKGKSRLDARMLEKKRERFVRRLERHGKTKDLQPISANDSEYHPQIQNEKLSRKHTKAELQRRHNEFHLMRKIQKQTDKRRRWSALAISTSCWIILWLVGAKIFQISEAPYQGWNYFNGVIFAFEAMTTIGYGDATPKSNSGKAFFVFWSLLSLPTLTILISNAGDTIVREIRDFTVLVGNITILPGEHGFKTSARQFLKQISPGELFKEGEIHEAPPGFLGAAQPHEETDEDEDARTSGSSSLPEMSDRGLTNEKSSPGATSRGSGLPKANGLKDRRQKPLPQARNWKEPLTGEGIPDTLPRTRAEYHLVLVDEIRRVTRHVQQSPPRSYSYQEWAWYLRLIGEDESDASTHRPPPTESHPRRDTSNLEDNSDDPPRPTGEEQPIENAKWSWIGHRSPLMDTRDESQFILDKLTQRLREELCAVVEESEGDEGIGAAEVMERSHHHASKRGGADNMV
ncbi:voltage-gated potassium channel [Xylariaceae sp. FL0255]|nr:voltage-gated potassium channel [Xylariaceae sp. FL0255]